MRQGLRNEHILEVALACAISDAALIFVGVSSFRHILASAPWIDPVMRYGGAAFLLWYGARNLLSALRSTDTLIVSNGTSGTLQQTLITCLALTWLNHHVYLDTVVLIGTLSTRFLGEEFLFRFWSRNRLLYFLLHFSLRRHLFKAILFKTCFVALFGDCDRDYNVVDCIQADSRKLGWQIRKSYRVGARFGSTFGFKATRATY